MIEIINAITDFIHALKYGDVINGRRDFKKLISCSLQLNETECSELKKIVSLELSQLKIRFYSQGNPAYVFLEVRNNNVKIYILNNKYDFLCRLEDEKIALLPRPENSFFAL